VQNYFYNREAKEKLTKLIEAENLTLRTRIFLGQYFALNFSHLKKSQHPADTHGT